MKPQNLIIYNTIDCILRLWAEDTKFVSSATQICTHASFKFLVEYHKYLKQYGQEKILLNYIFNIVDIMDNGMTNMSFNYPAWGMFPLLRTLTGQNPVPAHHAGKFKEITQDWKKWIKENK